MKLHFSLEVEEVEVFEGAGVMCDEPLQHFLQQCLLSFTPSAACFMLPHTSLTPQTVCSLGQLYENLRKGDKGGRKSSPSPQKRICNSAASGPNYSEALLKSATRDEERKREGGREGGRNVR